MSKMSCKIHRNLEQGLLFPTYEIVSKEKEEASTTFINNMSLPIHRWFRFSAGFSSVWAQKVIKDCEELGNICVLDPFAGSGTTLIASEEMGVPSYGIEAHPFIYRLALAKLEYRSNPDEYYQFAYKVYQNAIKRIPSTKDYPKLVYKCYDEEIIGQLNTLQTAVECHYDDSPAARLTWLTLVSILRKVSHANTAQWQYVLPNKKKKNPHLPYPAFLEMVETIYNDMIISCGIEGTRANLLLGDARNCRDIPDNHINLVITSPPYPNNYDYADATRLEMSFLKEIGSWGDLQETVRKYLIRSCSQHVPEKSHNLDEILESSILSPIHDEISQVCHKLAKIRLSKGGRKTYHLMVASYFYDLAQTWFAMRRVCASPSQICFVIGDSAPYGVYVSAIDWLGKLALAAGFKSYDFERTRDRNIKWKNRKHRVPLCEGRLWVKG